MLKKRSHGRLTELPTVYPLPVHQYDPGTSMGYKLVVILLL